METRLEGSKVEVQASAADRLNGYKLKLIRGNKETLKALENKLIFIAVAPSGEVWKPTL